MMLSKFSGLLQDYPWRVVFDGKPYNREDVTACLLVNLEQWKNQGISFNKESYVICIGFNSFHYFLYTILASLLNLKIIYASVSQIENLRNNYSGIQIQYVISPRGIRNNSSSILNIDFSVFEYAGNNSLSNYSNKESEQARIVFCTSGTTGKSKLVQYQEEKLLNNAEVVGNYLGFGESDICLCVFPTNYMYGFSMLISMLLKGGTVILERSTITPARIVEYLNGSQVTVLPVLRDLIDRIFPYISANDYYPNLMVINAADKIYKKHLQKILTFSSIFWNNFGQTESGPRLFAVKITANSELDDFCYRDVVAIGFPVHKDIAISVRDEMGNEVENGVIGYLYYRTVFGMDGYIIEDGSCVPAQEWQFSGDIVYSHDNGLVFWAGRKSQSIKINGTFVNINLLHQFFDAISEVRNSYFLYDEDRNEIYGYFVIGISVDKNNLNQLIADHFRIEFPQYPRLSQVHFIEHLPKTGTGKIDMQLLKGMAMACRQRMNKKQYLNLRGEK